MHVRLDSVGDEQAHGKRLAGLDREWCGVAVVDLARGKGQAGRPGEGHATEGARDQRRAVGGEAHRGRSEMH